MTGKSKSILAYNLKYYRQKRKITQEELAKSVGVSTATISNYESGKTIPDIGTLLSISRCLDVNMYILLGKNDSVKSPQNTLLLLFDYDKICVDEAENITDEIIKYIDIESSWKSLVSNDLFFCLKINDKIYLYFRQSIGENGDTLLCVDKNKSKVYLATNDNGIYYDKNKNKIDEEFIIKGKQIDEISVYQIYDENPIII